MAPTSAVYPKLSYDSINDFDPIGFDCNPRPLLLIRGRPSLTSANGRRSDQLAPRPRPGELAYGFLRYRQPSYLAIELFFQSMHGPSGPIQVPYTRFCPAIEPILISRANSVPQWSRFRRAAPGRSSGRPPQILAIGQQEAGGLLPGQPDDSNRAFHVGCGPWVASLVRQGQSSIFAHAS